ncbi:MAG: polysulfide reductase NrfD [Desulfobacteraceae bacterium]|nr:polysulfide reductase NrfD [Desulfobacteraceae bacterium]
MKSEVYRDIELAGKTANWAAVQKISCALFLIGLGAFLYGIYSGDTLRAWTAYLVNFVFWTGLAFGTFLLSPVLVVTNASWGRSVKRIAESVALFLPATFLLFWPLFGARETLFWWVRNPHTHKAAWLNTPFFFARGGIALFLLALVALCIVNHSVRSDLEYMRGDERKLTARAGAQAKLSPAFIILYAFILTLIAFDLMMALAPGWHSTLFGAYYFVISFYSGLAVLIVVSALAAKNLGMSKLIGKKQFHDLGKLLFAFCVVGADFFYVQFLVIWYGNKPEETRYMIRRVMYDPWTALAWTVLLVLFVVPFLLLLFRRLKMRPAFMIALSAWILCGAWLEKLLLISPSLLSGEPFPLGILEAAITLGWGGLFAFCIAWFLQRYPVVAVSDPVVRRVTEPGEEAARAV